MSYLCYTCMCLFPYSGVQHILCCVFVLFFFVCCSPCCQFLWIFHFWLPLRYSLTFIYKVGKTKKRVSTHIDDPVVWIHCFTRVVEMTAEYHSVKHSFQCESGVPVVLSLIGHVHTTDRKSRFMKEHTNEC
jgi:hypothetical protein